MQRTGLRVSVLIWLASVLASCAGPPEFTATLSDPGEVTYDRRLIGTWYAERLGEENVNDILLLEPGREDHEIVGTYIIVSLGENPAEQNVLWHRAVAYPSQFEGKIYFNIRRQAGIGSDYTEPGGTPGNIISRAEITEDGHLAWWLWGDDKLGKLAEEGRLKGHRVEQPDKSQSEYQKAEYLWIDVTRDELRALLRDIPDEEFFGRPLLLRRISKLPAPPADASQD
jgi:hypothetical protein